jgi:uncharacterized membrane protein YphA (DoxX/SURF4 family)
MSSLGSFFFRRSRIAAAVWLAATLITWFSTGAHRGWTRTTVTETRTDEVTGLEYPHTQPGFVAGFEFPIAGIFGAVVLLGIGALGARRQRATRLHA